MAAFFVFIGTCLFDWLIVANKFCSLFPMFIVVFICEKKFEMCIMTEFEHP